MFGKKEVVKYMKDKFQAEPEYLWASDPDSAIFRHKSNRKWFCLIMKIGKDKLGFSSTEKIDVMNVKCEEELMGDLRKQKGCFPGYHMNKRYWLTVALDGSVAKDNIIGFINDSFVLTDKKKKK